VPYVDAVKRVDSLPPRTSLSHMNTLHSIAQITRRIESCPPDGQAYRAWCPPLGQTCTGCPTLRWWKKPGSPLIRGCQIFRQSAAVPAGEDLDSYPLVTLEADQAQRCLESWRTPGVCAELFNEMYRTHDGHTRNQRAVVCPRALRCLAVPGHFEGVGGPSSANLLKSVSAGSGGIWPEGLPSAVSYS